METITAVPQSKSKHGPEVSEKFVKVVLFLPPDVYRKFKLVADATESRVPFVLRKLAQRWANEKD